jgi:insulysin
MRLHLSIALLLVMSLSSNVSAFIAPSLSSGAGALLRHPRSFTSSHRPSLLLTKQQQQQRSNDDNDEPVPPSPQEEDSVSRRQLLFSMLASAAAAPMLVGPQPVSAATSSSDTTTSTSTSTTNIMKPPLDDRDYEYLTLDNGLRVLLCSDPQSMEAAAAMDVHVGACSDPVDVPGLAHFHEHMMFLGTQQYPNEDSFEAFLAANGGSSNAFTDSENTVYYFNIVAQADARLESGLDRFGSFFTSPLFTEAATGRELNAIESENAKNLQSDIFRTYQIEKSRGSPQHPYSKFFTGNKKTLLDDTKRLGINLRQQLIDFNLAHYSANQMTLAVVAPQPISKLKKMVNDAFGKVPNRNVAKPELAWKDIQPFGTDSVIPSFQHVVEVVPVQELRQLQLSWPITPSSDEARQESLLNKQANYVSHLIGHEGPGSLLSYLKNKKGWANSFGASANAEVSNLETFEVTVELTTQGLKHVDEVAECVFSYITMLRNQPIPNYVFTEVLQLNELGWRFVTKSDSANYATSLSTAMQKFANPELIVAGPRRMALSKAELIKGPRTNFLNPEEEELTRRLANYLIDKLTVDNVMATVMSKTFAGKTDRKEKWYGTDYRVRAIPLSTLNKWRNPVSVRDLGVSYPKPNPFIPSEEGLRVKIAPPLANRLELRSFEDKMKPITPPRLIRDDGLEGRWTVYYKADDRFGQPKAFVIFQLLSKEVYSSPERAILGSLYQQCATDSLEEYAYDAELAGLTFDVQVLPRGVRLTFGGYNDKLQEFAAYVSSHLTDNINTILPKNDLEFGRYKDNLMRGLSAFDVSQPYAHASYYAYLTLQPRGFQYTNAELRDAVRKATLPDLQAYSKELWSSGKGEALVQGNVDEKEALTLVNTIDKTLGFKPIRSKDYPPRLMTLPLPREVPTRLTIAEPNPSNANSAAHVVLQSLGRNEKSHVLIEILSAIVAEPFYADLRTKQQLGYIVSSGLRAQEQTRTIAFIVQSSVQPVAKLTYEILAFLDRFEIKLADLSKADFAVYVKGLIDRKTEPDKQLAVEVTRNWSEIAAGRLQFDRTQREVEALLDVKKEDLLTFWKTIYSEDLRRVLITEIVPREGPASSSEPVSSMGYARGMPNTDGALQLGIDDIQPFRKNREDL